MLHPFHSEVTTEGLPWADASSKHQDIPREKTKPGQHPFVIQILSELGIEGNFLNLLKAPTEI